MAYVHPDIVYGLNFEMGSSFERFHGLMEDLEREGYVSGDRLPSGERTLRLATTMCRTNEFRHDVVDHKLGPNAEEHADFAYMRDRLLAHLDAMSEDEAAELAKAVRSERPKVFLS